MYKPLFLVFLILMITIPALAAGESATGLNVLEIQAFGRKAADLPAEQRLQHLEQTLQIPSDARQSERYRMSRLFVAEAQAAAGQDRRMATEAYNRAIDATEKGDDAQAIEEYQNAIAADPGLIQAYNNLANLLLQKNKYDDTIALYKRGLELKPDEPLLHRNLGVLYEKLGKIQDAVHEYEQYLKHSLHADPPIQAIVDNYRANQKTAAGTPDYFAATTHSSHGEQLIWPKQDNPIRIYIRMFQPDQTFILPIIRQSMQQWEKATAGRLRFDMTTSPDNANIVITLRNGPLSDPVADIGHTEYLIPERQLFEHRLNYVTITLNLGNTPAEKNLPPQNRNEQIYRMALHELGHAIGIWGHSPDPGDIMFTHPLAAGLSQRDVRTVRKLYGLL